MSPRLALVLMLALAFAGCTDPELPTEVPVAPNGPALLAATEGSTLVSIAAGGRYTCSLRSDGTVACWGNNDFGEATAPAGTFVQLSASAGTAHTCGVRSDGTVACWGNNDFGQTTSPAGTFVQVSAGGIHSCGVRTDGNVACWGGNLSGQLAAPAGAFVQVSAGGAHTCGVKSDRTVACWGLSSVHQTESPAGTFDQVSAGSSHTCGVKSDGTLACWGLDDAGQATPPVGTFVQVSAGLSHTCGVKDDGSLTCWGETDFGKATPPAGTFAEVSAGGDHTCGVKRDGTIACWGLDDTGQTTTPDGLHTMPGVSAGEGFTCAVKVDGSVACWGKNPQGQSDVPLDLGAVSQVSAGAVRACARKTDGTVGCWGLPFVLPIDLGPVTQLDAGNGHVCALKSSGSVACWGASGLGQLDVPDEPGATFTQLSVGGNHSCALMIPGAVVCWGYNEFGEGIVPPDLGTVTQVSAGLFHNCVVKPDGTVACWGYNNLGQTTVPADLGTVTQVSAGGQHTCAVKADGSVACWGRNNEGQSAPPPGLGTVIQVSAGSVHTCAVKAAGGVTCWGSNTNGETTVPADLAGITIDPCVVTSTGDAGAGSLRAANANHSCATITFDLALPATITLTSGGIGIFRDLSIEGPGADKLTIARSSADGTPEFRIFGIGSGNRATISGLTITNGRTEASGGGIFNDGSLTLSRSAVVGNAAVGSGGGIDNSFNMTITHSVIANNTSGNRGGGISHSGVSLSLDHSTVSGNRAVTGGGGILNPGFESVVVSYSTIVDNVVEAPDGRGGGIRTSTGWTTVRSSVVARNSAAIAPDVTGASGPGLLTVTHSLIGSPLGNSITTTVENGNLIGTAETPLDPKVGPLALNAPGSTATHALLEDSPAIDAGICTDGNPVTDDQRGFARPQGTTCDMGAYELEILTISTTTTLSISPSTQQYSDNVSLTASVLPASATGSVQFRKSVDGGTTFTDLGSPVTVATGSAVLTDHQVLQAAGTAVQFKAVFTASGNFANSTSDATPLTVTRENATIGYAAGNVAALQVSAPGGSLAANALTLAFTIKETDPDLAAATKGIGTITAAGYAGFTVALAPVSGGTSIQLACTAGTVTGTGYSATRPYSCKNAAALPVNTYEVVATVTGDYYTGTYADAFTVFDPSLGFATGGGSFVLGGDKVNFGFTMNYGKNGANIKGNFIAVRHHPDGTVSRLKANALGGLAIGEDANVPMGWASFNGKASYTTWDATANGGAGAYVTLGNQSFIVYAEDRNNPGTGIDRIWLGAPGTLAMAGTLATAKTNTAALTGGGIGVPHKAGKK